MVPLRRSVPVLSCRPSPHAGQGLLDLREALIARRRRSSDAPPLVGDLVRRASWPCWWLPIDKEAPKGRLILPQVQTIRDLLDGDAIALVVKERELRAPSAG